MIQSIFDENLAAQQAAVLNGHNYFYGNGVRQDYKLAKQFLEDALLRTRMLNADRFHAQALLAQIYLNGLGTIPRNYQRAFSLAKGINANQQLVNRDDYYKALLILGQMYLYGYFVDPQYDKAENYLNSLITAASQGEVDPIDLTLARLELAKLHMRQKDLQAARENLLAILDSSSAAIQNLKDQARILLEDLKNQ